MLPPAQNVSQGKDKWTVSPCFSCIVKKWVRKRSKASASWSSLNIGKQAPGHRVLVIARRNCPGACETAEFAFSKSVGNICLCSLTVPPSNAEGLSKLRLLGGIQAGWWWEMYLCCKKSYSSQSHCRGSRPLTIFTGITCPQKEHPFPRRTCLRLMDMPSVSWIRPVGVNKTGQYTSLERLSWSLTRGCRAINVAY